MQILISPETHPLEEFVTLTRECMIEVRFALYQNYFNPSCSKDPDHTNTSVINATTSKKKSQLIHSALQLNKQTGPFPQILKQQPRALREQKP